MLLYLAQHHTLRTTPRRTLSHSISYSYAHTRKRPLASCLFSLLLAVCFVLYFEENWDITNGDEDLTNCERKYKVRALLQWRLCRVFYFVTSDIGVVPSEDTRAQTATTAKKKIAHLVSCMSKDVYATLKSLCLPDSLAARSYKEIIDLPKGYYQVQTSATTASFTFRACQQKSTK